MAKKSGKNNILFFTEADWAGNRRNVISHVVRVGDFQVFYVNMSCYRLAASGSGKPPEIMLPRAEKLLLLLQSGLFDAMAGDCADLMILKYLCAKNGLPEYPCVMMSIDATLGLYETVGAALAGSRAANPARDIATATDVFWFCQTSEFIEKYAAYGIDEKRIFHLPMSTFMQGVMNPRAPDYLKRGPRKPCAEAKLAEGKIVAAGIFNRDYGTFARACAGLPFETVILTDMKAALEYMDARAAAKTRKAVAAAGNVKVAGPVPLEDYIDCLRRAGVVVVPLLDAHTMTGHLAIADAQRLGVPVIAADLPAARDFITHGKTGLLYRPGDPDSLKEQMLALVEDPALARRLGAAGRRREKILSAKAKEALIASLLKAIRS